MNKEIKYIKAFNRRTFNGRKDKGVFCIDKMFDKKYFKTEFCNYAYRILSISYAVFKYLLFFILFNGLFFILCFSILTSIKRTFKKHFI